jgi:hypothetical protein
VFYAFILTLCSAGHLFAQCSPNLAGPDFEAIPDTIVNLPTAHFPSDYEATIQMYIPTDTFVDMLNLVLRLDSLFITGISGLPITFSWEVYPNSGPIPGGTPICLQIFNPFVYQEEEGSHELLIHVTAWSVGLPANGDISGYVLNVEPITVGIKEVGNEILGATMVSEKLDLNAAFSKIEIVNTSGEVVLSRYDSGSTHTIDVGSLPEGIYLLRTELGNAKFLKFTP